MERRFEALCVKCVKIAATRISSLCLGLSINTQLLLLTTHYVHRKKGWKKYLNHHQLTFTLHDHVDFSQVFSLRFISKICLTLFHSQKIK